MAEKDDEESIETVNAHGYNEAQPADRKQVEKAEQEVEAIENQDGSDTNKSG